MLTSFIKTACRNKMGIKAFTVFNLLAFYLIVSASANAQEQDYAKWEVVFKNTKGQNIILNCEVADTAYKQQLGLMNRDHLDDDKGMIFIFKYPVRINFWMKNTKIPLSIAFIDAEGYILGVNEMQPYSLKKVTSFQKFQYAVEANSGWFKKNFIKAGTKVKFIKP